MSDILLGVIVVKWSGIFRNPEKLHQDFIFDRLHFDKFSDLVTDKVSLILNVF